jgi:hypothetical protein
MAPRFLASWLRDYEKELLERVEQSWIEVASRTYSQDVTRQEWVLFCLAAYIQGCQSSMKQDQIHFEFVQCFLKAISRGVTDGKIFSTDEDFLHRSRSRLTEYLAALSNSTPEEPLRGVASKFLANVGCDANDILLRVGATGNFMAEAVATKELFDKLKKDVRLVI